MSEQDHRRIEDDAHGHALTGLDQSMPDGAPTASDDQSAADADQRASERDQSASERDQAAADRDEAINERLDGGGGSRAGYAASRRDRAQSAIERDVATEARSRIARVRDEAATRRDQLADERDVAAVELDQLAREFDQIERVELDTPGEDGSPTGDRGRAAAGRDRGAGEREAAARDRECAANDRREAAVDRAASAEGLAMEGVDHVTKALRRRTGLGAIQREMDRGEGLDERLVVAFVEVDELKTGNGTQGDAAGDELLHAVVRMITQHLRSDDLIARFGASEFVCSLSGQDAAWVREQFARISGHLADTANGAKLTVGIAQRQTEESLDELIGRAQTAMMEARDATGEVTARSR
jgi:diguanylate cyclase (GGDEF)-like protein